MDLAALGIQEYTRMADDYNRRTGTFYYRPEDLRQAEKEINANRDIFESTVRTMAESLRWANVPKQPRPISSPGTAPKLRSY